MEGGKEGERKGKGKRKRVKSQPASRGGHPKRCMLLGNRKERPDPRLDLLGVQLQREGHVLPSACVCSNLDKQKPIRETEFPWQVPELMGMCRRGHLSLY